MADCPGRVICAASALLEGGDGVRFALNPGDADEKGFVVRYEGVARAYVNRCPHLGTELDWQPGKFFEEAGLYLVCATHGAIFRPEDGACMAGPCQGESLQSVVIEERDGQVVVPSQSPPLRPTEIS